MKELDNKTPVIILSALNRRETVLKAMEFGVKSYLIKPLKPNDILRKCKEVLELT
jgi:DNA-binding response OmpR family regulator